MLDFLRRRASSWIIKVTLGVIILSFVLFFGYAGLDQQFGGPNSGVVAEVNGEEIPNSLFSFYYERNYENLRQSFQASESDSPPDFLQELARSNSLRQLIQRHIMLSMAKRLGLHIPDQELASFIMKTQVGEDGAFDPIFYRHRYLPYFSQRYGIDYEKVLRNDLKLQLMGEIFSEVDLSVPNEASTWTFEAVATESEGVAQLFLVKASEKGAWGKLAKENNLMVKKIGPITLSQRHQLSDISSSFEEEKQLFALQHPNDVISAPLQQGELHSVVRLVKRDLSLQTEGNSLSSTPFIDAWIGHALATADVNISLDATP